MSVTSDYLRALADDMDENGEDGLGVVIITQEDEDAMMSSNIPQAETHNLLEAMLSCLTAPTYH